MALEPLEGRVRTICAKNLANAISVAAVAPEGRFPLQVPDMYMDKIAIGPGYPEGIVDLDYCPARNLNRRLAEAKGVPVTALTACILDRPRRRAAYRGCPVDRGFSSPHQRLRYRRRYRHDRSGRNRHRHRYLGQGGAPEGVLAAAGALPLHRRPMQTRLIIDTDEKRERAAKMGIKDPRKIYQIEHGWCAATACSRRPASPTCRMLRGVRFGHGIIETETVVMRSASGTAIRN